MAMATNAFLNVFFIRDLLTTRHDNVLGRREASTAVAMPVGLMRTLIERRSAAVDMQRTEHMDRGRFNVSSRGDRLSAQPVTTQLHDVPRSSGSTCQSSRRGSQPSRSSGFL